MVHKTIRRLMIVGLALLFLAPGTSAWGRSLAHRLAHHVFHIQVLYSPHTFPHHSRKDSLPTSKRVWVPGRWDKSTHDVLIWRTGHWTIHESTSE